MPGSYQQTPATVETPPPHARLTTVYQTVSQSVTLQIGGNGDVERYSQIIVLQHRVETE